MKKASPRNEAGSVKLEGGTGSLIRMIGLDGFMEAYKSDTTFRIQTPEDVDPQDTNPAAPWVVTRIDGIGASSPAVARVLLEGRDMLDAGVFSEGLDKVIVTQQLHACKEQLVICEQVSKRLSDAIRVILKQIESEGIGRDNRGRAFNPFPKVANLEPETTTFLIHMKRALAETTALVGKVLALDVSGSNFECLSKSLSKALGV